MCTQHTMSTSKRKWNSGGNRRLPKTLVRLIADENWVMLEMALNKKKAVVDESGHITEEMLLHFALAQGAPLDIVKLIARRYPQCLTSTDPSGKLACHVACKYGSSAGVVDYLIKKNKLSAAATDHQGKCPVHYVAEFRGSRDVRERTLQVISVMKDAAPESFNQDDDDGMNPIEICIMHDADIEVIKAMQKTVMEAHRKTNLEHEVIVKTPRCGRTPARLVRACNSSSLRNILRLISID